MEPNSREFYKQCAFQKFCNTVLHNEACDTHRELRRHRAKEVTFSDMTLGGPAFAPSNGLSICLSFYLVFARRRG